MIGAIFIEKSRKIPSERPTKNLSQYSSYDLHTSAYFSPTNINTLRQFKSYISIVQGSISDLASSRIQIARSDNTSWNEANTKPSSFSIQLIILSIGNTITGLESAVYPYFYRSSNINRVLWIPVFAIHTNFSSNVLILYLKLQYILSQRQRACDIMHYSRSSNSHKYKIFHPEVNLCAN